MSINHFKAGQQSLSAKHLNSIVDSVNALGSLNGDEFILIQTTPQGYSLRLNVEALLPRIPKVPPAETGFWAEIGSSAADGTNRWKYAWTEKEKTSAGYGGFTTLSGGRTGTTSTDPARNLVEDMNSGTGTLGNGVPVADLDTDDYTYSLQAAPSGVLVWINIVTLTDESTEYFFSYENGVSGSCD